MLAMNSPPKSMLDCARRVSMLSYLCDVLDELNYPKEYYIPIDDYARAVGEIRATMHPGQPLWVAPGQVVWDDVRCPTTVMFRGVMLIPFDPPPPSRAA